MDPVPQQFRTSEQEVVRLIREHPLAWVVTSDGQAQLFPVRPCLDPAGRLKELSGHFPRASGICRALEDGGRASFLFTGPSAYVSASWFRNRQLAPTWASMSVAIIANVTLIEDPAELRRSLSDLVDAMEDGRPHRWSLEELGERYEMLARRVVAFRAVITGCRGPFRLGQDEDEATFSDILNGLGSTGHQDIAQRMRAAREHRADGISGA